MEERMYGSNQRTTTQTAHKITLTGRKKAVISGVRDVLSFDACEVLLETEMGLLMLRGEELHVNRLTLEKGEIDVDGRVDSMTYSDQAASHTGESMLKRLFR